MFIAIKQKGRVIMIKTRTMYRTYSTDSGFTPWSTDYDSVMEMFHWKIGSHYYTRVEKGILVDPIASDATVDEMYAFVPIITTIATNR
jgi:hypothetical protein